MPKRRTVYNDKKAENSVKNKQELAKVKFGKFFFLQFCKKILVKIA